jgi:acyl-CoA reductase-like NAD-dependent aldehyde dehydrogenase
LGESTNVHQVCATVKRLYVHQDIYEKFLAAAVKATKAIKYGDPSEAGMYLGPTQNEMQFTKVKSMYEDVREKGYKVPVGGNMSKGLFAEPSLVDNPPNDSRIIQEEQFVSVNDVHICLVTDIVHQAPMLPIQVWSDEEEVIERANGTLMGLGANVWSKNEDRARRIADQLEAGSVFVNAVEMLTFAAPFGGVKESGLGVEGGPEALKGYCNLKVIHVNVKDGAGH